MEGTRITRAGDVALPRRIVELVRLKTVAGEPVRVGCEAVDPVLIAWISGLPGQHPPPPEGSEASGDLAEADPEAEGRKHFERVAPRLIEAGTYLLSETGEELRPAFYFGTEKPHPLAIPGRYLFLEDRALICEAIFELGGHAGGTAAEKKFSGVPADQRGARGRRRRSCGATRRR